MKTDDDALARNLLDLCAKRHERAFNDLYRMMSRRIHAFATCQLRDDTLARTVVSDTMYEVWKSASKFRGASRVSTWILGIANFKIRAIWRSASEPTEDIDDHADTIEDPSEDAGSALDRERRAQLVREGMNELSAEHRACIHLVYYEGLGMAEIAQIQQVPQGTVQTRLFHARKKLGSFIERKTGTSHHE